MKQILTILVFATMAFSISACNNQAKEESSKTTAQEVVKTDSNTKAADISVYYFHFTRRCVTCTSVENITKDVLEKDYNKAIAFKSVNLDDQEGQKLAEQFNVSGQTLIIVKNGEQTNLTNFAFLNAKNKPEALKTKLVETIDNLKKQ